MTGRPFIGLLAALVVEAPHWTRIRWEFDDEACGRAWQFTSIAIAIAAVLIWLDGNRYSALPTLLSWMPPLLLPLQFVQSYGLRDSLPLGMFSFLGKRRHERNKRLGLIEDSTHFNFGNVLFITTIVSATLGSKSDTWVFLPGIVILSGWILLASGRSRPFSLIPVLILAGGLALAGQIGLEKAEEWIGSSSSGYRSGFDPNFNSTLIGSRGVVRQSPDIVWRLRTVGNAVPPPLLRTATFNHFQGTSWQNQRISVTDFSDLDTRSIRGDAYLLLGDFETPEALMKLPSYTLRGEATPESPLPLPGDAAALRGFDLDGVERNSFGTVRVYPKHPVIDGTVLWKGGTNPEKPPLISEDLQIPIAEQSLIQSTVEDLKVKDTEGFQAKLKLLRNWFHSQFRYTTDLTIQPPSIRQRLGPVKPPTALAVFLNDVRAGHCEYFATAATLMLREAGIPARYAVGYAVMERDPKRGGYVIRGTHGHAWCRVWDESAGIWIDFDPTPPNWYDSISREPSVMQPFNDFLKRLREDFFIWRNRPANQLGVSLAMAGIGLALAGFVIKRLWRSKRQLEARIQSGDYTGPAILTPLHALTAPARKHLGLRPPGEPFAEWLSRLRPALAHPPDLDEAIALHQRLRFDPATPPQEQRERLAILARQLESQLKRR